MLFSSLHLSPFTTRGIFLWKNFLCSSVCYTDYNLYEIENKNMISWRVRGKKGGEREEEEKEGRKGGFKINAFDFQSMHQLSK